MATTVPHEPWSALLDRGRESERVVCEAFTQPRPARLIAIPDALHPRVKQGLQQAGIERLYSHQAAALEAAWAGPVITTTGTASGKSLCFNLPVLDVLCRDARARALYLYPTKALSQDQARALHRFGLHKEVRPAIYDGDTRKEERADIRRRSNLVLTNPDMLHAGILPNHRAWAELFSGLAVVVVDEAHVYRGVFGSHVANVLRRLRRVAAAYGTEPRILLASATVANPVELAQRLTGLEEIALVDEDGSERSRRQTVVWNPPVEDEALQTRRSTLAEAADVLADLVTADPPARTICFIRSRKAAELTTKLLGDELMRRGEGRLRDRVAAYRAGYTPQQRRELEGRLSRGELLCVVTTNALELGIDVGALDAAVVVAFPGTVASLTQMWGRAGRRGRGLAVYVAGEDALDQFFCRHPDALLERPVEAAILDHEAEEVHLAHLECAAHEGPLEPTDDAEFLGADLATWCARLEADGVLVRRRDGWVLRRAEDYPAARVSLRSSSPDSVTVVDVSGGEVLGTVEAARAPSTVHDHAVYLHGGRQFEVTDLDLDGRRALVRPFDGGWYTQPKRSSGTHIEQLQERRTACGVELSYGVVTVTEQVTAFQRTALPSHDKLGLEPLDLPPTTFTTRGLWFELTPEQLFGDREIARDLLGALHAVEHAQIAVLPLIAMCDRWDIGGLSTNVHPQTGGATIFVHDGHPGGIGIARVGWERFEELCRDALTLISGCGCESGCPSCVQSPKCGNLNDPLSKAGALALLHQMVRAA